MSTTSPQVLVNLSVVTSENNLVEEINNAIEFFLQFNSLLGEKYLFTVRF